MLRLGLRLALLGVLVPAYFLPAPTANTDTRRRVRVAGFCRWFLRMLGVEVHHAGRPPAGHGLVVCNHLSWLDPIIFMARRPQQIFVTSVEVRDSFFLGDVCKKAGCMFVERRGMRAVQADQERISATLQRHPVVVFPEATSTDGERVRPFKPAFFESARSAAVPVQPLCIRYRAVEHRPLTRRNRDLICWYGDMPFLPHFLGLLVRRHVDVQITGLPSLDWIEVGDRKAMAQAAHDRISGAYGSLAD